MDPVSHVAVGRILAGFPERCARGCIAAAVLGALAPDIDVVLVPFGWDRYLRVHEAGTHSILGTFACALLVALVVGFVRRAARYGMLVFFAWIGTLSHLTLDLLSSARHRLGWPFVEAVVSLPAVAMADPWLLGICAAGLLVVLAIRSPDRSRRAGHAVIAAAVVFLALKGVLGASALASYRSARDARGDPVQARVIEASWASLDTWNVLDRTPHRLRFWRSRARQPAEEVFSWPVVAESGLVHASRSLSTVRNFLRSHELAFAVELPQEPNRTLVLWSDIRFCWNSETGGPAIEPIVTTEQGGTRLACALWFGGELDALGMPIRELVKIGRLSQERRFVR